MTALERAVAEDDLERLRFGLPPRQHARCFTAGQDAAVAALQRTLAGAPDRVLLTAPAGAGKSHMLAVAREIALRAGYAVATVDLAEEPAVQLDRPDTLFGAVCRCLAIDGASYPGVEALLARLAAPTDDPDHARRGTDRARAGTACVPDDAAAEPAGADDTPDGDDASLSGASARAVAARRYVALASAGRWDYSAYLRTPALYIAVRAWLRSANPETRLLVDDWLRRPAAYREQQGRLYEALVHRQRARFRDPRPERQFRGGLLALHAACRTELPSVLADLGRLAQAAGLRGCVLLLDGLDEHCQTLGESRLAGALSTLLHLLAPADDGERPGCPLRVIGAATPAFAALLHKCRKAMRLNSAAPPLATPPTLALGEPAAADWLMLAHRLRCVHGLAYGWEATAALPDADLALLVHRLCSAPPAPRRGVAQGVVLALDARLPSPSPDG